MALIKMKGVKNKMALIENKDKKEQPKIMIAIPYTGLIRVEWAIARYTQVVPVNWSQIDYMSWLDPCAPMGFQVADARNMAVDRFLEGEHEWLLFIDHDVVLPQGTLLRLNEYMMEKKTPMVSGLYFTRGVPAEPLIFRGRGNGYFRDWQMGDKVWVDGLPMGCTLIHRSILKAVADKRPEYTKNGKLIKEVFETPARTGEDPETGACVNATGTEDLEFCTFVIENDILKEAGWEELSKQKYPFILDTGLYCHHIDFNGKLFPSDNEEIKFLSEEKQKEAKNGAFKKLLRGIQKEVKK